MLTRLNGRSRVREWGVALLCYSILVAPFGCQLQRGSQDPPDNDGDGTDFSRTGLFINSDKNDPVLLAGRGTDGASFFVFGTRDSNGNVKEIQSIDVTDAAGGRSFLSFEDGRPVHAQGADGSYVHADYTNVTSQRLTANVQLYNAATGESGTYVFDLDLQQTAQQIAELVAQVTGRNIDTSGLDTAKAIEQAGQVRITIISPLWVAFVAPFVAAVAISVLILGQLMVLLYQVVAITLHAVVIAAFSPLFLLADLLGEVVIHVQLLPVVTTFEFIPDPPVIILI